MPPDDVNKLSETFREMIGKVPEGHRAVILIDAVNQLDEFGRAHEMTWLPDTFPLHVKIIVSCIEEPEKEQPALISLRRRNTPEVKVEPLTNEERFEIVTEVPSISAKSLDPKQIGMLLKNPATNNPLYLIVALEELRGFGSFEKLNQKIQSFPRMEGEEGLNALFTQVIERLETEIGRTTVCSALSLISSSRMGLSEREISEILGQLKEENGEELEERTGEMQVMLRQIRPYLLRRAEYVDFYHRNLWKAVNQRYLKAEGVRNNFASLSFSCVRTVDMLLNLCMVVDFCFSTSYTVMSYDFPLR